MEVSGTGQGADKSDSVAGAEGDLGKTAKRQLRTETTTKLGGVEYKFLESLIYGPNYEPSSRHQLGSWSWAICYGSTRSPKEKGKDDRGGQVSCL